MGDKRTVNLFMGYRHTPAFWALPAEDRQRFYPEFEADLGRAVRSASLYQIFPTRAEMDGLLWLSDLAEEKQEPDAFFACAARAVFARRAWLEPVATLWGLTRPSQYARGQSAQEIDPFDPAERKPYLVVYPFVKTAEWYLLGRDTRQGMMNEHIRTGHQYPEIKQLLLYSFGLQDQEFVVVYETDDLGQFSALVNDLRGSDARPYTLRDTPTYTGLRRTGAEMAGLLAG